MIVDTRSLENGTQIRADICIVGGGPVGIAIARSFAGSATTVCLIESGGWNWEKRLQALYSGHSVGHQYFALQYARVRHFGGSSNQWGGFCRPFDAIDFEPRDWLPYSGWPLDLADLESYYREAETLCEINQGGYAAQGWFPPEQKLLTLDAREWRSLVWQLSPRTRFGERHRRDLEVAANCRVYLHANVTEVLVSDNGAEVIGLEARTLDREAVFGIRAQRYVLACGGLENPRILLASNRLMRQGVGNQNDRVGRFFMEHPHIYGATLKLNEAAASRIGRPYFNFTKSPNGDRFRGLINLTDQFQRQYRLTNVDFSFYRERFPGTPSAAAAVRLWQALERHGLPEKPLTDVVTALRDLPSVGRTGLRWFGLLGGTPKRLLIRSSCEQAPNPDSRVTLERECDALGMPRLVLNWRFSEIDRRSIEFAYRRFADALAQAGLGSVSLGRWVDEDGLNSSEFEGGYHHMGTTRMSDDPRTGVVDRDCRVHGMTNLYIAGSSVFATSGCANPMLTTIALALRLATHLSTDQAPRDIGYARELIPVTT